MLFPLAINLLGRYARRVTSRPGKAIFLSMTVYYGLELIETAVIHSAGDPQMWRELETIPLVTMVASSLWMLRAIRHERH